MKAAFSVWNNRVAPLFDVARRLCLLEVASDYYILNQNESFPDKLQPAGKARHLAGLGVDELICGAISRSLYDLVVSCGIQVIPFVAGDLGKIIRAWQDGTLEQKWFAMPGCCQRDRHFYGIAISSSWRNSPSQNKKGVL